MSEVKSLRYDICLSLKRKPISPQEAIITRAQIDENLRGIISEVSGLAEGVEGKSIDILSDPFDYEWIFAVSAINPHSDFLEVLNEFLIEAFAQVSDFYVARCILSQSVKDSGPLFYPEVGSLYSIFIIKASGTFDFDEPSF